MMTTTGQDFKYLAIKNWEKYQSGKKGWGWIKDYVNQNDDEELSGLSMFERGLLQELRRVRGRSGKNIHNDVTHISRAIHAKVTDRPHLRHAIDTLIARNILILTNQQDGFLDERRGEEKRGEEKGPPAAPPVEPKNQDPIPSGFTPEDLAPTLLTQIGIGLTGNTAKAAIEAIRVKASQSDWDPQKACLHIIERAHAYRASPVFRAVGTRFKSWEKWLIEGCYDEPPESWNGSGKKAHVTESGAKIDRGFIPLKKNT